MAQTVVSEAPSHVESRNTEGCQYDQEGPTPAQCLYRLRVWTPVRLGTMADGRDFYWESKKKSGDYRKRSRFGYRAGVLVTG